MNFAILEFNKTRHSLYNNLDYLGLNPYEQKHFCFHGSTDGDESGDTAGAEAGSAFDDDPTDLASADPSRGPGPGQGTGVGGGRGDDPRAHGYNPVEDARSKSQAQQQSYQDMMDDLYNRAQHVSRAKTYTDFFGVGKKEGKVGAALGYLKNDPDLLETLLEQYERKGYAPRGVVTTEHGVPVETTFGYLTQGLPEEEEYENRRSRREQYLLPYKKNPDGTTAFSYAQVPGLDMLMDPVIQDVMFSPEPEYDNRRYYTEAVREASQAMTPEERYGVLDPTIPFEDPLYGTRIGGYLPTLEESGLPTYMGGFRGSRETDAPFALTKEEADRYEDIFMAFAGTKGGAIRAEIDNAKSGQTVEDTLTEAGLSSYGLPKEAEASALANYMDMEALKGWAQGVGIVTSMTSPFMPAVAMGLPQDVWEDVKEPLNSLRNQLKDVIPNFEKVEEKFDKAVDVVRDNYEKNVEQTGTDILNTIFDAINGKGASQEAREFGSNYQLPTISAPAPSEPTVEDIAPIEEIDLERAIQTPDNMLADIAGRQNMDFFGPPTLESYLENIQELPMIDSPSIPNTLTSAPGADTTGMLFDPVMDAPPIDIGGYPSGAFFDPDPIGPPLDLTQPVGGQRSSLSAVPAVSEADRVVERAALPISDAKLAEIMNIVNTNTTVDPVVTDIGGVPASDFLDIEPMMLYDPVTPAGIQQLAPLPEEVDIEQAAFIEPPVVETVSQISPDDMNKALTMVGKMARDPENPVTIDDYRAVENARTKKEFVDAVQVVIDKDKERGRQLEKKSGVVYKRGN